MFPAMNPFLCVYVHLCTQAVYLKTNESVALPVYQVLPDQPTKIAAVQKD